MINLNNLSETVQIGERIYSASEFTTIFGKLERLLEVVEIDDQGNIFVQGNITKRWHRRGKNNVA